MLTYATLLTNESYLKGVVALKHSLDAVDAAHPLVVLAPADALPASVCDQLDRLGCTLVVEERIALPAGDARYACEHFADCWIKLRLWSWTQYERIVYLDADMVVLKNIDELLERGGEDLCAVQECFCPVPERRHMCPYSLDTTQPRCYFNAGMLVLRPDRAVAEDMTRSLQRCTLSAFAFAEQDFLNDYFAESWASLPYGYNASKALYACHRDAWDYCTIRVLHFTMAKPWDLRSPHNKGYAELNNLWLAAYAEPGSLGRLVLQIHLREKKRRRDRELGRTASLEASAGRKCGNAVESTLSTV